MSNAPTIDAQTVLAFNGRDGHVALPALDFDYSRGFTVEAWVRYDRLQSWSPVIDFGNGPGADNVLLANQGTLSNLHLHVHRQGECHWISAGGVLNTGEWMHLAATIDADGRGTLYKNGRAGQSSTIPLPMNTLREKCYIGRSNWPENAYFAGRMTELRVWSCGRSTEEIQGAMYRRLTGREEGLIAYWPLNDGEGATAHDKMARANHGALHGAEWSQDEVRANLAFKQPTAASSTESGTAASNVVDGGHNSSWISASGSMPQWWQVDLGRPLKITGCQLDWGGAESAFEYSLSSSADGETWRKLVAEIRQMGESALHEFQADDVRYFRVTFLRSNTTHWPCLREVAVFSEPLSGEDATLEELPPAVEAEPEHAAAAATDATVTEPTSATEPSATEPSATEPSATEPSATEPSATEPSATEPTAVEPASAEPTAVEPTAVEPAAIEPAAIEPTSAEPGETNAAETEPAAEESVEQSPTAEEPTTSVSIPEETGSESMATTENQPPAQTQNSTTGEQEPKQKRLLATGLEDYGFWMQWRKTATPKPSDKPFRRGRIWA